MMPAIPRDRIAEIVRGSDGLRRSHVAPGAFGPDFLSSGDIAAILRAVSADPRHLPRIRAYTETAQRPDLQRAIFDNPPEDDDLEAWGRRLFGGGRFGIVVDRPPLGDALAARLGAVLAEFYGLAGVPLGGAEPHIFLGDYGFSPFGAHQDQEVGRILHFHLGPGAKTMHIWDEETYVAATGGRLACFDPAPILDRAEGFRLKAGSVFVLPTEGFHVGHTPEFSIGFAVCLIDASPADLARRAGEQALATALAEAGEAASATLTLDLAAAMRLDRARAASNLHLVPPAEPRRAPCPQDRALRRFGPFPIVCETEGEAAVLAGRGHALELPASPALSTAVARLNGGEMLTAGAIEALLTQDFDAEAARFLVETLWQWGALEAG